MPPVTTGTAAPPVSAPPASGAVPSGAPTPPSAPMDDSFGALDGYMSPDDGSNDASSATPPASDPPTQLATDEGLGADLSKQQTPPPPPNKETPPPPKADVKPPTPPKPQPDGDVEKGVPKPFRDAYSNLKLKVKELEQQLASSKADPNKPDPKYRELEQKLAEREKRLAEIDEQVKFTNYEKSNEYQKTYWEPFVSAFNEGREAVSQLRVASEDRMGTSADFDRLMKIQDPNEAAELASDLFGAAAPEVLAYRRDVIKANNARVKAINDFKAQAGERSKREQENMGRLAQTYVQARDEAIEKLPQYFKPGQDKKANELLEKGFQMADMMFTPNHGMDGEKLARYHSIMRNKAGAFDRVAYDLVQANKKLADLQKKLDSIEASAPAAGVPRGGPKNVTSETDWQTALDKLQE